VSCRKIAFFDFDGTITKKDTLLKLILFQKGTWKTVLGSIRNLPWLTGYWLGLISNDRAKQQVLRFFFGGLPVDVFQDKCDAFAELILPGLVRPAALQEIRKLQEEGGLICVVSSSAENWIRAWTSSLSIELIATRLEVFEGRITGNIEGKNCHGEQKVISIRKRWNLEEFDQIFAYGDTNGDKPMLALATRSFYKPFR